MMRYFGAIKKMRSFCMYLNGNMLMMVKKSCCRKYVTYSLFVYNSIHAHIYILMVMYLFINLFAYA